MGGNNKYSHFILALVLLISTVLFTVSSATAVQENFNAAALQNIISMCACDLSANTISVLNTGDITSVYSLDQEGTAAQWSTVAPQAFALEHGEQKTITQFINVPCRARGEYTLNTKINTLFGLRKDLQQTVRITNCPNVEIQPIGSSTFETCPCSQSQYQFEIKNTGNHAEEYKIAVNVPSSITKDAITLSNDVLILEPNERKIIFVFTNLDCGVYGDQTFTLTVLARGSQVFSKVNFGANIVKCYDYALSAKTDAVIACKGVNTTIPVAIKSQSGIANEYRTGIVGPAWITLPEHSLFVSGGEQGIINLLAAPSSGTNETVEIVVNTVTKRGDEYRALDLAVEPQNCYDHEFIFELSALTQEKCRPKDHGVLLVNSGTKPARVNITLVAPEWMELTGVPNDGAGHVKLAPQQHAEFFIKSNPPCDFEGEQSFDLVASYADAEEPLTTSTNTLRVITSEQVHAVNTDLSRISIDYNKRSTPVTITHTGTDKATYELELLASAWMTLDKKYLTLAPGEVATVNLTTAPEPDVPQDTYNATIIAHAFGMNTKSQNEFVVHLYKNKYYETTFTFWNTYHRYVKSGFVALVLLVTVALIMQVRRKKDRKEEQPTLDEFTVEGADREEWKKIFKTEKKKQTYTLPVVLALLFIAAIAIVSYLAITKMANSAQTAPANQSIESPITQTTADTSITNTNAQNLITTPQNETVGMGNRVKQKYYDSALFWIFVGGPILIAIIAVFSFIKHYEKQTTLDKEFKETKLKKPKEDVKSSTHKKSLPVQASSADDHKQPTSIKKYLIVGVFFVLFVVAIGYALYGAYYTPFISKQNITLSQKLGKTGDTQETAELQTQSEKNILSVNRSMLSGKEKRFLVRGAAPLRFAKSISDLSFFQLSILGLILIAICGVIVKSVRRYKRNEIKTQIKMKKTVHTKKDSVKKYTKKSLKSVNTPRKLFQHSGKTTIALRKK